MIAVEVHQQAASSSDLVFGMDFSATVTRHDPQVSDRQRLLDSLRISEVIHNPGVDAPLEFIELQNTGVESLNLQGVRLDSGIQFTFPDVVLPPGQRVVVAEDLAALLAKYGSGIHAVGQYDGNLNDRGEEIMLQLPDPYDAAILRFTYDATWFPATTQGGRSLEIQDPNLSFTAWSDKSSWTAGSVLGGTPGYQTGSVPAPDGVVINEVLTHTDPPLTDAIELHNRLGSSVNLSG